MSDAEPDPARPRLGDGAKRAIGVAVVVVLLAGLVLFDRSRDGADPASAPTDPTSATPESPSGSSLPLPSPLPEGGGQGKGRRSDQGRGQDQGKPATGRAGQAFTIPEPPAGIEALVCEELSRPVPLVVLSFNIKRGYAGVDRIAAEVARSDADIVLMQEVGRYGGGLDQAGQVASRLEMDWAYGPAVSRPGGVFGNAILSRHEILDSSNTRLPFAKGTIPRALLRATIELKGRPVNLYSTHLQDGGNPVRVRQAAAVSRILATDPLPRLVGGDMNSYPGSAAMSALLGPVSDPWPTVGSGAGGTGPRGGRIDYVLPSAELVARGSVVMPTGASDHRIVRTALELPAGAC